METQWEDVEGVFQTLSTFSRMSKGHSPLQLERTVNTHSYESSPIESRTCSSPPHDTLPSESVAEVIPDKSVGFGRGKILQNLEKKFKSLPMEQFDDTSIHSELREIGCEYSNEMIERAWGCSYSPSKSSQFESLTSDDDAQDKSDEQKTTVAYDETVQSSEESNIIDTKVVDLVEGFDAIEIKGQGNPSKPSSPLPNSPQSNMEEVANVVKSSDALEIKSSEALENKNSEALEIKSSEAFEIKDKDCSSNPHNEIAKPHKTGRHNRQRKVRNAVVLNMQELANAPPTSTLKAPDAFLKPSKMHSYSAALGSSGPNPFSPRYNGDSIFSAADFPAL